jgi:hypothetical protein
MQRSVDEVKRSADKEAELIIAEQKHVPFVNGKTQNVRQKKCAVKLNN